MTINPISAPNTAMAPAANATTSGATNASSERNLFMTLLVAQLKNQDPLAPQDGTAFVAQLAQFNSLDQLIGIRQSIDALNTRLSATEKRTATTEI